MSAETYNEVLNNLIKIAAARMSNVYVHVDSLHDWVTIKDTAGQYEDIFLQGDDGSAFISEARANWDESGHTSLSECYLYQAEQYCENLWN